MCYDAIAPDASAAVSAAAPRDIAGAGKKKRVNRSAKLKQCKLDARREQWLSQVKNKDVKVTGMAVSPTSPLTPPPLSLPRARTGRRGSEMRPRPTEEREDPGLNNSSDSESPSHSPTSSCSGRASRKDRPPSCFGSGCSIESSSRTVSDAEFEATDRGGENGVLDDWEVVADALSVGNDTSSQNPDSTATDNKVASGSQQDTSARDLTKPEPIHPPPRAWRPDDSSRPRTLPSLSSSVVLQWKWSGSVGLFVLLAPFPLIPHAPYAARIWMSQTRGLFLVHVVSTSAFSVTRGFLRRMGAVRGAENSTVAFLARQWMSEMVAVELLLDWPALIACSRELKI